MASKPVKRDVVSLAQPPQSQAPPVHRDIVTLSNLPALLPNDPRQRMLQQHRFPPEMLDMEFEDDEEVHQRLDAMDTSLPSLLAEVIDHDVDFTFQPRKPVPVRTTAFPKAAHRSQKPNYGLATATSKQATENAMQSFERDQMEEDSERCAYQGWSTNLPNEPSLQSLEETLSAAIDLPQKVDAMMLAVRSQVISQRVLAINMLTQLTKEERASNKRQGAIEYIICGEQQVAYVTCLRMALDDRNYNVVTAALQWLLALISADDELVWLTNLLLHNSYDGTPFHQLLSLHCCSNLDFAKDEYIVHGKEPSSEEELKSNINANLCIALLSMSILPRLRYCLDTPPVDTHNQGIILDILIALCVRTTLAGKAIAECPHMMPAVQSFLSNPARLSDVEDVSYLRLFTKAVVLLTLVGQCGHASSFDDTSLFSTMQAMAFACHTERLRSDLRLLHLVQHVLSLWAVCCFSELPILQPIVADSFSFLAQFVQLPFTLYGTWTTGDPGESASPVDNAVFTQVLEVAFNISHNAIRVIASYTRCFASDARRNGEDLDAFLQTDTISLLRMCFASDEDAMQLDEGTTVISKQLLDVWCRGRQLVSAAVLNAIRCLASCGADPSQLIPVMHGVSTLNVESQRSLGTTPEHSPLPLLNAFSIQRGFVPLTTLQCPSNLLWIYKWTPELTACILSNETISAYLHLQYDALTLSPEVQATVEAKKTLRLASDILRAFNLLVHQCFTQDPLDHPEPQLFIASHRLRLSLVQGEVGTVYISMLLVMRLTSPSDEERNLLQPAAVNLTLLLTPNCCHMYHFLMSTLFAEYEAYLLPFFRVFGIEVPFGPQSNKSDRSFYYTYYPAAEGAAASAAKPFHLDHFWLWKPILGPHLQMAGLPESEITEATLKMHQPLFLDWLKLMLQLETIHKTYVSFLNPIIKLVCATNVFSMAADLIFDTEVKSLLGQLVTVYMEQHLQHTGEHAGLVKDKVLRLKPHLERLLEVYSSAGYGDPACSQLVLLFLHTSMPEEFQALVLEEISTSKTAFLQLGQAFSADNSRAFVLNVQAVLPGFFIPAITQMRRIDRLAELLVILPNQMKGAEEHVKVKLHRNLIYWYLIHHTSQWIWQGTNTNSEVLSPSQRRVLAGIVQESNRPTVLLDLLHYCPSGEPLHSLTQFAHLLGSVPQERLMTLRHCSADFPELQRLLSLLPLP